MNKEQWVINWFVENASIEYQIIEQNIQSNYIEEGMIDSFGFIQLISDIEEEFKMSFDDDDFMDENIFTIKGISEKIEERLKNE